MFSLRAVTVAKTASRLPITSVRAFSTVESAGKTWGQKEKAAEEQYFKKIEAEKRQQLAEKIQKKELRSLLAILGDRHNLTEHQIHDLLEWKHGKMD